MKLVVILVAALIMATGCASAPNSKQEPPALGVGTPAGPTQDIGWRVVQSFHFTGERAHADLAAESTDIGKHERNGVLHAIISNQNVEVVQGGLEGWAVYCPADGTVYITRFRPFKVNR